MQRLFAWSLLYVLLITQSSQGLQCGFPGQPYGGFLISPSLPMPVNSNNQWNQQGVYGSNQQVFRSQQSYNGWNRQQFDYQSSNWQYQQGGYPNQQQPFAWGQQMSPYQAKPEQSYLPSVVSAIDGTNQILSYPQVFNPGDVVMYTCRQNSYDALRGYQNRTCQEDGTWSFNQPWCDINVAYGRSVMYADNDGKTGNTGLLTDGLSSPDDGAECILLKKGGGAYLTVDLGQELPVRDVQIVGKPGEGMGNLVSTKVSLGMTDCPENAGWGNATTLRFQCNRESIYQQTSNRYGNVIRFEHASMFALDVCEVVAYANPTLANCGVPEIPAYGNATITTNSMDQVVLYTCSYGYELRGNSQRTCRGRTWDGAQPICVEVPILSTTSLYNVTNNPLDGGYPVQEAMPVFAIVLIVVCVCLAIGLLVAFLVLMKYGQLKCCSVRGSVLPTKKKHAAPKANYVPVTAASSSTTFPVSQTKSDSPNQRVYKDPEINTSLSYANERSQRSNKSDSVFSEFDSEPRSISPREMRSQPNGGQHDVITHAQIVPNTEENFPGNARKESDDTSTISSLDEPSRRRDSPRSVRKPYIPPSYAKHSPPEVQMRQKAVNDELSDRVSRMPTPSTETDI